MKPFRARVVRNSRLLERAPFHSTSGRSELVVRMKKCPICAFPTRPFNATNVDRPMCICTACRHIYFSDVPTPEELGTYYSSYTDRCHQADIQESNAVYYRRHLDELRRITNLDAPAILDYGCSIPYLLREAASAGSDTLGVDVSEEARVWGAEHGVRIVPPEGLDDVVETFDVIRFSHVLEHMIDPVSTLQRCMRNLGMGGIVYITQPNFPGFRLDTRVEVDDAVWPSHLHFFSPLSLLKLAERCGLTPFRLFTHGDLSRRSRAYCNSIDLDLMSSRALRRYEEASFGSLCNAPWFLGANSVLLASLEA